MLSEDSKKKEGLSLAEDEVRCKFTQVYGDLLNDPDTYTSALVCHESWNSRFLRI